MSKYPHWLSNVAEQLGTFSNCQTFDSLQILNFNGWSTFSTTLNIEGFVQATWENRKFFWKVSNICAAGSWRYYFIYHSLSPASISMLVTCYVRPVPIKGFWIIHSFVYTNHKYHYKTSITVHHTRTPSHSSSEHSVSIKIEEWMCDSFHISFLEMRCDPVLSRLSNIFRSHWGRGSGGQWDWDPDKM